MGILDGQQPDLESMSVPELEALLAQLRLGQHRTADAMQGLTPPEGGAAMLEGLVNRQRMAQQQLQGMGGDPMQALAQGTQMASQLSPSPPTAAMIEADPSVSVAPPPPRPQQPQQQGGLLSDLMPSQPVMQPSTFGQRPGQSMTPAMLGELYSAMAAGADDPSAIGMDYAKRMQTNASLQRAASQARTGGFNPIVDDNGKVWFPSRQADGTTGLTPALNTEGEQISTDPRFTTLQTGGGGAMRIQTSGGAAGTGGEQILTPEQFQGGEGTAAQIARMQEARRNLPSLENAFAREGGAYDTVTRLIDHPSRELMTGASTVFGTPWSLVPGTDAQEFRTLEAKLSSQAFINSIQELRSTGATVGQITEREGDKLQAAGLALNRAAQEGDYLQELQNFQYALARFMLLARQEAGQEDPFGSSIGEAGIDLRFLQGDAPADPRDSMTDEQRAAYDKY